MLVERDLGSISVRGWVLVDDGAARRFGAALAWAWRQGVQELHVLVDGADGDPAGVVARRAAEMTQPPSVWAVNGRRLNRADPAPAEWPAPLSPDLRFAELLRTHGATPVR